MIPDSLKKNVLIPVKIVKGQPHFFYGGELPKLAEGTIGDLIVPSYSVIDKKKLTLLEREETKVFIPKPQTLMVQISPKEKDDKKEGIKRLPLKPYKQRSFVAVNLEEDLKITLRSTKKGELEDCSCSIPSLPEAEPKSLNHAYTLISQHFETHRRSHSGNVFDKVFFFNKRELLNPLKELRGKFEYEYEQELILLNQDWFLKECPDPSTHMWALVIQKSEKKYLVFIVDQQSQIINEKKFDKEADTIRWIKINKFVEYDFGVLQSKIKPPSPPYQKNDGEKVMLKID